MKTRIYEVVDETKTPNINFLVEAVSPGRALRVAELMKAGIEVEKAGEAE